MGSIRKLIAKALTKTQFEDLLYDNFSYVYDETQGLPLSDRRRELIRPLAEL